MAIGKPRGKSGMRPIYVYDPSVGRKVYVGSRQALRGPGGAQELEREKQAEFAGGPKPESMSCGEYADRWLVVKHGPGTRREAESTEKLNRGQLKKFREEFGDRELRGGISRVEALDWSRKHAQAAKVVSAMFNDAMDDMLCDSNPFGNRRLPQGRGRKDIVPLREDEVARLAELAVDSWKLYGRVFGALITFLAWTACRPSEAFAVEWKDVDVDGGRVTVRRVKGAKRTETIVLPAPAVVALKAMPGSREGLVFRTQQGRAFSKGNAGYYWRPVRVAFQAGLDNDRRRELESVKGALDLYALRHFGASLMADRGLTEWDISHQMGNSPEVARKHYVHQHRDRTLDRVALALSAPSDVDVMSARSRKIG